MFYFLAVFDAHKQSTDALEMIHRTLTDLSSLIKLLCIGLLTFLWADYKRLGMTWQLKKKEVDNVIIQSVKKKRNKTYFLKKMQILKHMAVKTRLPW